MDHEKRTDDAQQPETQAESARQDERAAKKAEKKEQAAAKKAAREAEKQAKNQQRESAERTGENEAAEKTEKAVANEPKEPKEKTKLTKKQRNIIIAAAVAVVVVAALLFLLLGAGGGGDKVFVMSVRELTGGFDVGGTSNRFAGVVESQETLELKLEQGRTVKEVFVEVGQDVQIGDELFSYETSDISLQMQQASLEIERMRTEISNMQGEITQLEAEKASAPPEQQLDYTLQIQSLQSSIKTTQYNIRAKQLEYDQLKKTYDNSVVTATMAGTVEQINDPENQDPNMGGSDVFMVIMKTGDFVVKGTVSELNIHMLSPGMQVIVRSRIDETKTWAGTISAIDTSKPQDDNNNNGGMVYYGGMDGGGSSASKYSFFVDLDSIDGLMIGQHVTIEPDFGQSGEQSGLALGSYYIVDADTESPFVWTENARERLEKRYVTLGDYNADMDSYVIVDGLTVDDYIAFPEQNLKEGMRTTKEMPVEEDPGLTDPGFEDPGFEDPGFVDPGFGEPEPGGEVEVPEGGVQPLDEPGAMTDTELGDAEAAG